MSMQTKALVALFLLLAAFAGGAYWGRGQREVVVTEGKTVEKVEERIVTVTKVIRPDGTIEETTKTEEKQTDTKTKEKSKATSAAQLAQYGVGVAALASLRNFPEHEYSVTLSRRILGPAWLELQGTKQAVGVGVRIEF